MEKKGVCVCVCFWFFTTDLGPCRFYRMGIHLRLSTGPRAGALKGSRLELRRCAWASVQQGGVRGNISVSQQTHKPCSDLLTSLEFI